jgi:hypothetical protein
MNRKRMLAAASVGFVFSVGVTCLSFRILHERLQPAEEMTTGVTAPQKITLGNRPTAADPRVSTGPVEPSALPSGPEFPKPFLDREKFDGPVGETPEKSGALLPPESSHSEARAAR